MDQSQKTPLLVTILLMPIIYFTIFEVLTGSFSNDLKATVVGTVVGSLLGAIYGRWLGGHHLPASSEGTATKGAEDGNPTQP